MSISNYFMLPSCQVACAHLARSQAACGKGPSRSVIAVARVAQ